MACMIMTRLRPWPANSAPRSPSPGRPSLDRFDFTLLRLAMIAAVVAGAAAAASAAPDDNELGKGDGYPIQSLTPEFSMMNERYKVGTFSHMEKVFWPRTVAAASVPSPLPPSPPFDGFDSFSYVHNGQSHSLEDFLNRQRVTGLLVLKDGRVVVERYQYDRKAEHRFTSMSMAKTVVALLVGIALKDGKIASLDDAAEKYAPDLKGSVWGRVTLRNLLRMSSGAKWSDKVVAGAQTDIARLAAETYFQRARGGASAITWVKEATFPQGWRFNYASAETFALALALRGAIGVDLSTYFSEKIWKTIGAESDASWLIDWSGMESGYCCINARLRDYGRLGVLMANDGAWNGQEVVPKDFFLEATDASRQPDHLKPRRATPFFGYGYQTWLYPYATRTFQARGLFGQELIVQPESRIVVVMTSVSRTPDTASDVFVERSDFVGALLKALGGKADPYR
jgi:CubicO group peptidase (beta-lactamase class C family)